MSLTAMYLQESARRKFFMNSTYIMLGSAGRNESNSSELARIGKKKIFHEFDVHHV